MQRMRGAPGMLRGLAEHRAELGRPPLGDMAVTIAVRGLVGARNQAGVTRDVLGTAEALDIGEDGDGGEGDDRADAGDRLEPADIVTEAAPEISEEMIHGADLLAGLLPHRVVKARMGLQCGLARQRVDETFPPARVPQTAPGPDEPTRSPQQALRGIDLGGLNSDEVAATGERRPQRTDGWTWNVNDRAIEITAKPIAQFEGVPPIALLAGATRLETNFMGVDDDRLQAKCAQRARHIKSRGSGLQSDRCAWWQLRLMTQARKGLRCRGQRPAADDRAGWVLDHEYGFTTVNIEANVVGSHRAVLPVRRMFGAPYGMTPWRTANVTAVSGGPPRVFIDTCLRSATRFRKGNDSFATVESTGIAGGLKLSQCRRYRRALDANASTHLWINAVIAESAADTPPRPLSLNAPTRVFGSPDNFRGRRSSALRRNALHAASSGGSQSASRE